jgi:hypothetical protein
MNPLFSDYNLYKKTTHELSQLRNKVHCDRLISAFNDSDRVVSVFHSVDAPLKHWVVFPEYNFTPKQLPSSSLFACANQNEDEFMAEYFDKYPILPNEKLCFDITGFMRPHLLFLLRLLKERKVSRFDLLYSEPVTYAKGEKTTFSDEIVSDVRQVRGFEGMHSPSLQGDYLIVGCGYDHKLMEFIANHKSKAKKIQLFPFPALRPHMYQENRIRTQRSADAFGNVEDIYFAPAYDPFVTASVLVDIADRYRKEIKNLYLSPLATKPQVVGFGLYYLRESHAAPVSIIFPFSNGYSQKTSRGISKIWQYTIDFTV